MKQVITYLLFGFMVLLTGCASSGSTQNASIDTRPKNAVTDDTNAATNLADFLRKVSGVTVMGSGDNVRVNIRGSSSFYGTTEPLYVVDGQPVGTSYSEVNNMVNVREIDYVNVLKGSDAAIYGVRGGNGVIEIVTKKQ